MTQKCDICMDLKTTGREPAAFPLSLSWRVINDTPNFVVTPSLGPIVEGYTLVWPKRHMLSLKYLNNDEIIDLENTVDYFEQKIRKKYGKQIIIFEHGQVEGCNEVSCGVNHAHLHIVPIDDVRLFFNLAESLYITKDKYLSYKNFYRGDFFPENDYMLISSSDIKGAQFLSYGDVRVSQALRKILAECCGQGSAWNWRDNMNIEKVLSAKNILTGEQSNAVGLCS